MYGTYTLARASQSSHGQTYDARARGWRISRFLNRNLKLIMITVSAVLVLSVLIDSRSVFSFSQVQHEASHISSSTHPATDQAYADAADSRRFSKIGKLSMLYGNPGQLYERALAAHKPHNDRHGYRFDVLYEKTLPSYWTKPAYILQHLLTELAKPEVDRLEWLVWFDADAVLMNPNIPLEIFLPPTEEWSHIHCVVTNDHRGLNNGVFFLRVHEWSVWLMNACLGTETFDPAMRLEFGDQSALMYWLDQERFQNNTMHVPQRWFNAYPGYRGERNDLFSDPTQPQNKFRPNSVKEGDLLVHHAGHKSQRTQRMQPWIDLAEQHSAVWEMEVEQTTYMHEIEEFWRRDAPKERRTQDKLKSTLAEIRKGQAAKAALKSVTTSSVHDADATRS